MAFAIMAIAGAASVCAQDRPNYAEAALGRSTFSLDRTRFERNALAVNSVSTSGTGYVLRVGRDMGSWWGLEAAYSDSGYMTVRGFDATAVPWRAHLHLTNWTASGVARYQLNEGFRVFGRFGGLAYENEIGKTDSVLRILPDQERGVGLSFGAGIVWTPLQPFSISLSADRHGNEHKTTSYSLGVRFGF